MYSHPAIKGFYYDEENEKTKEGKILIFKNSFCKLNKLLCIEIIMPSQIQS